MKKILCTIITVAILASMFAVPVNAVEYFELGDKVPDFSVELCDGTVQTLSELLEDHKCVMINIWATWCGPCRNEFPAMNEAWEMYKDDVALLCLSPFDTNEEVAAYREENDLTLPMGFDSPDLGSILVKQGYPTTAIVDCFGNYVYYETGAMFTVEQFTTMFDTFIGDDYTESQVIYEINGAKSQVANPTDEELSKALSPDGTLTFTSSDSVFIWPFVPEEDGVVNSDAGKKGTSAKTVTVVNAEAGDVLAFDYAVDVDELSDTINVIVNDKIVKTFTSKMSGSYGYCFEEAGEYEVELKCNLIGQAINKEASLTARFSNARLISGEEASAFMESMPAYPHALEGDDFRLEVLNDSAKKIIFDDPNELISYNFSGLDIDMYMVPEETVTMKMLLGENYDESYACGFGDYDGINHICSLTENDGTGYIFETAVGSINNSSYSNTYIKFYPDASADQFEIIVIFADEDNINYFIEEELQYPGGTSPADISWSFAD